MQNYVGIPQIQRNTVAPAISPKMPTRDAMHHVHLSLSRVWVSAAMQGGRKEVLRSPFWAENEEGTPSNFHTPYTTTSCSTSLHFLSQVKCGVAYRKSLPGGQKNVVLVELVRLKSKQTPPFPSPKFSTVAGYIPCFHATATPR